MKTYLETLKGARTDPCIEYPGTWLVYLDGQEIASKNSLFSAKLTAFEAWNHTPEDVKISVCWSCSDNDPRIGEVWFTGFYCTGKISQFGGWTEGL